MAPNGNPQNKVNSLGRLGRIKSTFYQTLDRTERRREHGSQDRCNLTAELGTEASLAA